ncbi:P-type conjugative transfer protein TrbG [Sphingomonas spermidinifaciens]|uniref:P-type conjugative transfer protein TrbG n=1 Tax=Sphingomonas spermidinifaciens TaxID=1141889 RepID=A0A2A4B1C0_9SPHN|nr:P-type conjugative transfer protein TrbG [Sphingomonas spermidinifaciens]PCD02241.1 P-type conjugative transfer protein TrbG [Sphingomonas spermidinifaciens]
MILVRPPMLLAALPLAACAASHAQTRLPNFDAAPSAVPEPEPPKPVEIVRIPEPLPLPAQLKPLTASAAREQGDPKARIGIANAAARMQPVREGFLNAIQLYPWAEGALYQLYAAPGQVTDIALQEGEQLVGSGPVAAGDTVRWIIGDTVSGTGAGRRVHILIKPTRTGLVTNLVINTDRRTYHLELRSTADTYMASVSWTYPQDALIALTARNREAAVAAPAVHNIDIDALNFGYHIEGDRPAWRPLRAFDDGRQVFVELPASIAQSDLPPLFVVGAKGEGELVNYRVRSRYLVVDRLFARAELRLAAGKSEQRVRILRQDNARRGKSE